MDFDAENMKFEKEIREYIERKFKGLSKIEILKQFNMIAKNTLALKEKVDSFMALSDNMENILDLGEFAFEKSEQYKKENKFLLARKSAHKYMSCLMQIVDMSNKCKALREDVENMDDVLEISKKKSLDFLEENHEMLQKMIDSIDKEIKEEIMLFEEMKEFLNLASLISESGKNKENCKHCQAKLVVEDIDDECWNCLYKNSKQE